MNKKDKVLEIANQDNGILLTKQITDAGIYRSVLQELEAEEKIIKVQHGVYVTADGYANEFFSIQHKVSKKGFTLTKQHCIYWILSICKTIWCGKENESLYGCFIVILR